MLCVVSTHSAVGATSVAASVAGCRAPVVECGAAAVRCGASAVECSAGAAGSGASVARAWRASHGAGLLHHKGRTGRLGLRRVTGHQTYGRLLGVICTLT